MDKIGVTNGAVDPDHYGPIGDAARGIASYCDDPQRVHVYTAAFDAIKDILATRTDATPVAWMPIESAPTATTKEQGNLRVLVIGGIFEEATIVLADGEFWRMRAKENAKAVPTHWMPLPASPGATNTHPPATDVAALVEAAKAMFNMPGDIDIDSNPPELQREALEARRQAWNALRQALAPFTKGQP